MDESAREFLKLNKQKERYTHGLNILKFISVYQDYTGKKTLQLNEHTYNLFIEFAQEDYVVSNCDIYQFHESGVCVYGVEVVKQLY